MKRLMIAAILSTIAFAYAKDTPRVLLFMRSGSGDLEFVLKKEVMVMKDALERSGFKVVVATLDGSDFSAGSTTVKADIKLGEAKVSDYAGFILPCMMVASYPEPAISQEAIDLVKGFIAAGKPVAAQTGSLWTLAKAGVLKGKKYAYAFAEKHPYFEGATFAGTGVVRDGLILTSGLCPHMARTLKTNDGSEPLALALAEAMSAPRIQVRDEKIWEACKAERDAVVATLRDLVSIESPSNNDEGLRRIGNSLAARLTSLDVKVERIPAKAPSVADHIIGRIQGNGRVRILLLAHMDTIYPAGTLAKQPFRIEGDRAYAPGIADERGGLATILYALKILRAQGFRDFGQITILFNTDEEVGSPDSGSLITRLSSEADVVLSHEPAKADKEYLTRGTAATGQVVITVHGRAAHAGKEPERGRNALVEIADIVLRTRDIDDPAQNFRFNWTLISGGEVRNQIPDKATATADVRYFSKEVLESRLEIVRQRLDKHLIPDTKAEFEFKPGRPAYQADGPSDALIARAVAIYSEVGGDLQIVPRIYSGTDAGYAQLGGKPVLECLGLVGDGSHSAQEEYIAVNRIPARLYLLTRLLIDLSKNGVPQTTK